MDSVGDSTPGAEAEENPDYTSTSTTTVFVTVTRTLPLPKETTPSIVVEQAPQTPCPINTVYVTVPVSVSVSVIRETVVQTVKETVKEIIVSVISCCSNCRVAQTDRSRNRLSLRTPFQSHQSIPHHLHTPLTAITPPPRPCVRSP